MDPSERSVYLTFDDGPIPESTPFLLETLRRYGVKATFFVVGENVQKHPDLFRQIIEDGHQVGNHTYHHLGSFKHWAATYLIDTFKCQQMIGLPTPYRPTPQPLPCREGSEMPLQAATPQAERVSTPLPPRATGVFRAATDVAAAPQRGANPSFATEESGEAPLLLHACCAPCSSAIVEWMLAHGLRPTIFYYNPNIFPREEYEIRKQESKRHAESLGLQWIDGDYDHEQWQHDICGLEHEPERGRRCEQCFTLRLIASARKAQELNLTWFTTTLASSRWKSIEQITRAGQAAEAAVPGTHFWAQNWRKGGLYERRNQLLREYNFYNQQYCGCEFSMRKEP